jgi:hypothetical protein
MASDLYSGGQALQISAETPVNLAEVFRDSPKPVQGNGNTGVEPAFETPSEYRDKLTYDAHVLAEILDSVMGES